MAEKNLKVQARSLCKGSKTVGDTHMHIKMLRNEVPAPTKEKSEHDHTTFRTQNLRPNRGFTRACDPVNFANYASTANHSQ